MNTISIPTLDSSLEEVLSYAGDLVNFERNLKNKRLVAKKFRSFIGRWLLLHPEHRGLEVGSYRCFPVRLHAREFRSQIRYAAFRWGMSPEEAQQLLDKTVARRGTATIAFRRKSHRGGTR